MIEDYTEPKIGAHQAKIAHKQSKLFTFSPLEELDIIYDSHNQADIAQINKIVLQILNFPSTQLAQFHTEAMRLGNYDLQDKQAINSQAKLSDISDASKKCPCCGFTKQVDNIKLCTPIEEVKNIGESTFLYFSAYKHLSILLMILGLLYSIYAMVTNLIAARDNSTNLTAVIDYISISISAKQLNQTDINCLYYEIQCWIGLGVMIIWIFVFTGLKYFEIKGAIYYDNLTSSIADYSVVMQGMPLDVTKEELQSQLNSYYQYITQQNKIGEGSKRPFKIARLNKGIPFYLDQKQIANDQIKHIQKELAQLKQTFTGWIIQRQSKATFSEQKATREESYKRYTQLMKRRIEVFAELQNKIKKQLRMKKGAQLTTVFVTFQTNIARDLMIQFNQINIFSRIRGIIGNKNSFVLLRDNQSYRLEIRKAPEPEDIIWTNIGLNDCSFYGRKFFTFSVTLLLLAACFAMVFGLSKKQQDYTAISATDPDARFLSIVISVVISLVNILLSVVINFLTNFERNYTTTNRQTSLAIKSIIAQMINSIVIPVIVAHYIKNDLYNTSGLVDNIFMMSITGSFVAPALVFFDPLHFFKKLLRYIKSKPTRKLSQNQRYHNNLYLGVEFQVGNQYIYMVNLFMFVCYFASLQPICVFIALSGYLFMYWVQKYCMFYRYRRPVPSSDLVNKAVFQIIIFGPLLYSLGSLTWSNLMPGGAPAAALLPNLIALGFSILFIIVPLNTLVGWCCFSEKVTKQTKYDDMRISFSSQYDRMNPSTQEQGFQQYYKFCENFGKNIHKLSLQKQKELKKKLIFNSQRGHLHHAHQQSSRPLNFGSSLGLETTHGAITSIMNQPIHNLFTSILSVASSESFIPQSSHILNQQGSARIIKHPKQRQQKPGQSIDINAIQLRGGMGYHPLLGVTDHPTYNSFHTIAQEHKI